MIGFTSLILASLMAVHPDLSFENTNVVTRNQQSLNDFNRLRADINLTHKKFQGLAARLIVDNENIYQDKPNLIKNDSKIYRAYLEYRGDRHSMVIGRQRIPLGVGRIWNPIDIYNPINVLAIEPAERPGTEAIHYEYAINDLTDLEITCGREKYAARLKGYLNFADLALVALKDNYNQRDIIGWEFSGELLGSGIELRSEGGSFYDFQSGKRHTKFIGGLEYAFANSITLLGEYYFNDESQVDHFGAQLTWQPGPLWTIALLPVINLTDNSFVVSPTVAYSLSDEATLTGGAFSYHGTDTSEFGSQGDLYFLRWFTHF